MVDLAIDVATDTWDEKWAEVSANWDCVWTWQCSALSDYCRFYAYRDGSDPPTTRDPKCVLSSTVNPILPETERTRIVRVAKDAVEAGWGEYMVIHDWYMEHRDEPGSLVEELSQGPEEEASAALEDVDEAAGGTDDEGKQVAGDTLRGAGADENRIRSKANGCSSYYGVSLTPPGTNGNGWNPEMMPTDCSLLLNECGGSGGPGVATPCLESTAPAGSYVDQRVQELVTGPLAGPLDLVEGLYWSVWNAPSDLTKNHPKPTPPTAEAELEEPRFPIAHPTDLQPPRIEAPSLPPVQISPPALPEVPPAPDLGAAGLASASLSLPPAGTEPPTHRGDAAAVPAPARGASVPPGVGRDGPEPARDDARPLLTGSPRPVVGPPPSAPLGLALLVTLFLGSLAALSPLLRLYTRLRPDRVLLNPIRRAIFDFVRSSPACSCMELARAVGVHHTTARRHLLTLARFGLVVAEGTPAGPRFFENHGRYRPDDRAALALLRRPENAAFLRAVASARRGRLTEVARCLGIAKSTASRRAAILERAGILARAGGRLEAIAPSSQPPG